MSARLALVAAAILATVILGTFLAARAMPPCQWEDEIRPLGVGECMPADDVIR